MLDMDRAERLAGRQPRHLHRALQRHALHSLRRSRGGHLVQRLRRRLVPDARRLQHIGPLATRARVAVLQVLPEMVRAKELLALVALAKLVHVVQVFNTCVPVRWVGKLAAAVAAGVGDGGASVCGVVGRCKVRICGGRRVGGRVEGHFEGGKKRTRPGMFTQMK